MARTQVAVVTDATVIPGTNTPVAAGAGTAIDPTNGMYIATNGEHGRYLLFMDVTTGTSKTMTVKQGVNPPAFRNVADATIALTTAKYWAGPFESAAFSQSAAAGTSTAAGDILLDFTASTAGTIWALLLPNDAN